MGVALEDLVGRLQAAVAAIGGVPDATQYGQCVRDAAADYSRRRPMQRMATVAVVSGTASYDLPADFIRLIQIESPNSPSGVIVGNGKLIPVSSTWQERTTIAGGKIVFYPTPTYSMDRDLWYAAAHVLDDAESYPDMSAEDAGLLLLKAQALAVALQANAAAGKAWMYQMGDERVDKTKLAESLRGQAKDLEERYATAIKAANGVAGLRG